MRLRRAYWFLLIIFSLSVLDPAAFAYKPGYFLLRDPDSESGPVFALKRPLGSGGYSEVWEIEELDDPSNRYAVKLYRNQDVAKAAFERFTKIYDFMQAGGGHARLANLGAPETYGLYDNDGQLIGTENVIFVELTDGSLQDKIGEYQLTIQDKPDLKRSKLKKLNYLKSDLLEAINYLYQHGISHFGINPRNILVDGNAHMLTGFGNMAPWSTVPPERTFEYAYAPLEWTEHPNAKYSDTQIGDIWCAASVLYQMLFGVPPLRDYHNFIGNKKFTSLRSLRTDMHARPNNHNAFEALLDQRLSEFISDILSEKIYSRDWNNFAPVLEFIKRGLIRDLQSRKKAILVIAPSLEMPAVKDACPLSLLPE